MWNRPDVDFVDSRDPAWHSVPAGHLGSMVGGAVRKTLSRDPEEGAQTDLPSFTNAQVGVLESACDFYVLAGRGRVCGASYAPGTYVFADDLSEVAWEPEAGPTVVYATTARLRSRRARSQFCLRIETRG